MGKKKQTEFHRQKKEALIDFSSNSPLPIRINMKIQQTLTLYSDINRNIGSKESLIDLESRKNRLACHLENALMPVYSTYIEAAEEWILDTKQELVEEMSKLIHKQWELSLILEKAQSFSEEEREEILGVIDRRVSSNQERLKTLDVLLVKSQTCLK